jgi:hypothetical protein
MPAREVLAGKVLAIGAVGLAQFAVIAAAGGVTVQIMNRANAPNIPAGVLAWTVLWFVLGYFFYSVVYAALGATTSRIEDAQAAIAPVTGMMILAYLAVIYAEEHPDAVATVLLSYFPPSAPMVMTYRVALGAAPAWQLVSSALLMALVICPRTHRHGRWSHSDQERWPGDHRHWPRRAPSRHSHSWPQRARVKEPPCPTPGDTGAAGATAHSRTPWPTPAVARSCSSPTAS